MRRLQLKHKPNMIKKKVKFYTVYFTDTPFAFIYHL